MNLLAVDTETTGLAWEDGDFPFIATASDYDRNYVFQLVRHPDDPLQSNQEDTDRFALRAAMEQADGLVFHNASFDIHMLDAAGIMTMEELLAKPIYDTNILARLVLDEWDFRLKHLAVKYIDSDADQYETRIRECMLEMGIIRKIDQKDVGSGAYYEVWKAYRKEMEDYAEYDTRYTYDLYQLLQSKATPRQLRCFDIERAVQPVIVRMEHRGVAIDTGRVSEIAATLEENEEGNLALLHTLNGEPFDPGKRSDLLAFFDRQGVVLTARTKTDNEVSTAEWALERHADVPAVRAVLDYRTTNKVLTTYARPMLGRATIHADFYQIGAKTGRMSCRRPNLQNIPVRSEEGRQMRGVFIPRPGYVFVDADYSSIELRLLAYYSNSDTLWDVINKGDPFLWLGAQIYGTEDQETWPVTRQKLKNGFYAMMYGAGGPRLAQTIGGGMTPTQGKALAKSIRSALGAPYAQLQKRLKSKVMSSGFVTTLAGRTQWIARDKNYVALNALIQGSAADIMKVGLSNAEASLTGLGGYPLLVIHDEIVAEVPNDRAEEGLRALRQAMEDASNTLALNTNLVLKTSGIICKHSWEEAKG